MKYAFAALQLHGNRAEGGFLLIRQHCLDLVHVSAQASDRKEIPFMAPRHVIETTILKGAVVQGHPASDMRDRFGARPIRIVLMPGDHSAVVRGLTEQLIMPEAHGPPDQLGSGDDESRIPENVMERRLDSP